MASKAVALNVRLGVIFDEKTLAATEKALRRSGEKLSRIGSDLTLSLSAPLGLFGGAAIKAAGDLESLTLALQSQLGSAEKAGQELEKLTKIAEGPGLGLEQVVGASIRLQGVGIAAGEARDIIKQLGNSVASVGFGAENFDSVTKQFTQMIAKGRVLQEDLSIIAENMPNITTLMQKAFGTQSAEGLRALNVGAKEFIQGITAAAAELPRVKSGIKNNIENAMDAVKIALGKVGLAINDAFDIKGGLEKFAKFITDAAAAFNNLSAGAKTAIAYMAGFLVAIGPIAKVIGSIQVVQSFLVGTWKAMLPYLKDVVKWLGTVRTALIALSPATQAFIAIGLAVAIASMAYEMGAFNRQLTATEKAMQVVNDLTAQAKSETAGERAQVESLIKILGDENTKREDKIEALNELKSINPQYFGQLTVETATVDNLKTAYEGYAQSIIKAARAKGAEAQLVELDKQRETQVKALAEAERQYNATRRERVGINRNDGDLNAGGNTAAAFLKAQEALKATEQQIADIIKLVDGYAAERVAIKAATTAQTESANAAAAANAKKTQASEAAIAAANRLKDVYKEVQADIQAEKDYQNALGAEDIVQQAETIEKGLKRLIDAGFSPTSAEVENLKQQLKGLYSEFGTIPTIPTLPTPTGVQSEGAGILPVISQVDTKPLDDYYTRISEITQGLTEGTLKFGEAFTTTAELISEQGTMIENTVLGIANAMAQSASEGATSMRELAQAAISAGLKIIRSYIQQGVASAVSKALTSVPFPFNIAAGAAAGSVASVLFTNLISKIGVNGFARGTAFAPGGMALVGEKGPELVNIPRGSQVISNMRTNRLLEGMGQSGGVMQGEFTVRGTDLVLVLDRAKARQSRVF
jgi:tape measure domain-containing protein